MTQQLRLARKEGPATVVTKVTLANPLNRFVRVSAFGPSPEHLPRSVVRLFVGLFGRAVPVVVRPTSYHRVEISYHLSCGRLLVAVEIHFDAP